jgi:integrase
LLGNGFTAKVTSSPSLRLPADVPPQSRPQARPRHQARIYPPLYYVRWTENGRSRERSTGESDPRKAQEKLEKWAAERRRTRRVGPGDPAEVLIRHVVEDYAREHSSIVAAPATILYAAVPLLTFFARDTMAKLTPKRAQEYWIWRRGHSVKTLKDGTRVVIERQIADGTIIRELAGTLRPAIEHAINHKRLAPGRYYVPVPEAPRGRDYWITRQEAARLVWETRRDARARLHLPLYTVIALYTGQRRGAILDLRWTQVDLVAGRINFNPPERAQTKKRRPVIPIPRSLLAALRRAQKRASCEFVISYRGERVRDVKTGFNSAAARAGIPDCTSHTLRHTAGTYMAQRGVPLREIAGYLGHSEATTTERYAHHHPSFMENARKAFE